MTNVTILSIQPVPDVAGITIRQHAEIEVSDGVNTYAWRVGNVPPGLDAAAAQTWLAGQADSYFAAAQAKAEPSDVFSDRFGMKLLFAVVQVVLDEVNAIRALERTLHPAQAGQPALQDRTLAQVKAAIKTKLQSL